MAAHGEKSWPSAGTFSGRPWGGSHGRRHSTGPTNPSIPTDHTQTRTTHITATRARSGLEDS